MSLVFQLAPQPSVPVLGQAEKFPVRRIYCVGRNYEEHAKEMGFTGREPPFFFLKPADALVVVNEGSTGEMAMKLNWSWPLAQAAETSKLQTQKNTFMATPSAWT